MGWTPRQVQECTFWEFASAFAGWKKFNCVKEKPEAASLDRLRELGIE